MVSPLRRRDTLEPPSPTVELEDSGAHDLEDSGDEQHFSDASEGEKPPTSHPHSRSLSPSSHTASPVPKTRVERVDGIARYGETPGLPAYEKRKEDAVPDELEVVPQEGAQEGPRTGGASRSAQTSVAPSAESEVPLMVVEKVDPEAPSHGEMPGTAAYAKRLQDAAPDLVYKSEDPNKPRSRSISPSARTTSRIPIPATIVTPSDGVATTNSGTTPQKPSDEGSPASGGGFQQPLSHQVARVDREADALDGSDDEGAAIAQAEVAKGDPASQVDCDDKNDDDDDDFGEFDDGLQGPENLEEMSGNEQLASDPTATEPVFPLPDFASLSSLEDLVAATQGCLDAICPNTTSPRLAELPTPEPLATDYPIFPTERSQALWKQLITPPPLRPPNWTKSHIRRRFLISLGMPVDLDEILPPSKQKKLVLPDMHLETNGHQAAADRNCGAASGMKTHLANDSTGSIDSTASPSKSRRRRRGPAGPPELDLGAVKRLCATTDEKLDGMTDSELAEHVQELQVMSGRTDEALVYWLKRRDGAIKEKEAFEGVIENLVRHARQARK